MKTPFVLLLLILFTTAFARGFRSRRLIRINPSSLAFAPRLGYSQITVDTLTRTAYISGQTAVDTNFKIQGVNLEEQLPVAVKNVERALEAIGASQKDILKITVYIVGYNPKTDLALFSKYGRPLANVSNTLVGVERLAFEGMLVEIEATAIVPWKLLVKMGMY